MSRGGNGNGKMCIPPTNREMGAIGCLFVGIAFGFVHVLLSTIFPHAVVSIVTKPITPVASAIACLLVAKNIPRILVAIAFFVYAAGDVFLEIDGKGWTDPAGVAAFAVGHVFFAAATFVGKRQSLLKAEGLVGRAILFAVIIIVTLLAISYQCDTTMLMRLAKGGYLSILLFLVICIADITYGDRNPASVLLSLGVKILVVSDVMAFSRSMCNVPNKFIVYNILEMIVYYLAILCLAGGAAFLPCWKK